MAVGFTDGIAQTGQRRDVSRDWRNNQILQSYLFTSGKGHPAERSYRRDGQD